MSKIVKGIGKVFKKVVKTVVKIAPFVLAAAAVVFTGGAALGLGGIFAGGFSGAVGGLVGSLGLSGAVGGALTGAITQAGFGAAIGGVLGGKKGLMQGALAGAVTGGAIGAISPGTFIKPKLEGLSTADVTKGLDAQFASKPIEGLSAPGTGAATSATANVAGTATGAVPLSAASYTPPPTLTAPVTPSGGLLPPGAPAPTAPAQGGGLLGFFNQNPALAGPMLTGVASTFSGGNDYSGLTKKEKKMAKMAWEGAYTNNPDPFGTPNYGAPPMAAGGPTRRWRYNPDSHTVEEVEV